MITRTISHVIYISPNFSGSLIQNNHDFVLWTYYQLTLSRGAAENDFYRGFLKKKTRKC